jgi:Fe-S-cluster containining protein
MKPTDFSIHVTSFLTHYLAAQRNLSPNTIKAYRDVFTLLLRFCRDVRGIAPEKLRLEQIDVSLVEAFLDHLETERKSSPRTRNHRLATLHAFFRYVQAEEPAHMLQCQKILAIPLRRHARPTVAYLSKEELAEILAQPDLRTSEGRRDAVWLSVLSLEPEEVDSQVFETTRRVWAEIECTSCANCCREVTPSFSEMEVSRLAQRLGIERREFIERYLERAEAGSENPWQTRAKPCPFLKENRCSVYEDRPADCSGYPYLYEPDFAFRTIGMIERTSTCPIVYQVMEDLKKCLGFSRKTRR